MPAESRGWEIWHRSKLRKSIDMLDEVPKNGSESIVGLPAQECTTLALTLPTSDESLFTDMIYAQLERRGLATQNGSTVFAHHVIERNPGESLISVDVLPPDFSEDLCLDGASGYTAAARLYTIPDHKLVLMRHHDRLVLVAGKHGRMTFSQILTSGTEINESMVQEINLSILSLQGSGQLPDRVGLEVWLDLTREETDFLQKRFSFPVEVRPQPSPNSKLVRDASNPLLPIPVQEAVARQKRMEKIRLGALCLALVYVIAAVTLMIVFQHNKTRAANLAEEIEANRPQVAFIQEALTRQQALEPAFDKKLYPVRQLNEIARVMPPSGIVVHKFASTGRDIRIEGLARESQLAYQLKEDLEKHPDFPGYTWDMAPPQVNQNNTAAFRLDGKYATSN